jgi:hypothetical protein
MNRSMGDARDGLLPTGDQLFKMASSEPDVLADPGAADAPLLHRVLQPPDRYVQVVGRFLDGQQASGHRRQALDR